MHLTQLFDLSLGGRADRVGLEYVDRRRTPRSRSATSTPARTGWRRARGARPPAATGSACTCQRRRYLDIFLACARLGAMLVPINALYRERELRHIVSDAEPVATSSTGHGRGIRPA